MNLSKYAISKGMNLEQYENLKSNIQATAQATIELIKTLHKIDTGVYYPISEILSFMGNEELQGFIIMDLKSLGVEFFDNNSLYRY